MATKDSKTGKTPASRKTDLKTTVKKSAVAAARVSRLFGNHNETLVFQSGWDRGCGER